MTKIVNFLEVGANFSLAPTEAIAVFVDKGLKPSFAWQDMLGAEHDAAFTVAKMMDTDLLQTVQAKLTKALEGGSTLADFKKQLIPELQAAGWWGKKDVIDPITGLVEKVQLGSASRLENIFRSNMQSAYATGQWDSITRSAKALPYLLYDAVDDHRVRPEHADRDGEVHPVNSDFWKTHYPPNGWNCRCGVIQLSEEDVKDMDVTPIKTPTIKTRKWVNPRTGVVMDVPIDTDPGWNHNPGIARQSKLAQLSDDKASKMLAAERRAHHVAMSKRAALAARYKKQLDQSNALQALVKPAQDAQLAITKALKENTPYLANEIKKLQSAKPDMDPVAMIATAHDKALKSEQNSLTQAWKQAMLKGKEPSEKSKAFVATLPEDKLLAMQADIDAKTGASAAKAELAAISAGETKVQTKLKQKILEKWSKDGTAAKYSNDPKGLVTAVAKESAEQQVKAEQASALSGYKKKVLDGKIPTPKQQQVFNSLDDTTKAKVLADIDAKKPAPVPEPAPATPVAAAQAPPAATAAGIDTRALVQIGPQRGSNPGGLYQDTSTGQKWYIKQPADLESARNEVLTAKLYQAAGVEVPELQLLDASALKIPNGGGNLHIASRIIDGVDRGPAALQADKVANVRENFVFDAWLANWDVVGLEFDNLLVKNGRAIRVDTGGGLLYRAQGKKKGAAFGNTVIEIDTLRDASINPQAASIFKNVTDADIKAGVARLEKITDQEIGDLVQQFGPTAKGEREALLKTLIARKADLVKRYGGTSPQLAKLKAEAAASAALDLSEAAADLDNNIITAIKGIATRAAKGEALEVKDVVRVRDAREQYTKLLASYGNIITKQTSDNLDSYYGAWLKELELLVASGAGAPARWSGGKFDGYKASGGILRADPEKMAVTLPNPGSATFTEKEIKEALQEVAGQKFKAPKGDPAITRTMTRAERSAIYGYTTSVFYRSLNAALRNNGAAGKPAYRKLRDILAGALDKGKPYVGQVARGLSLGPGEYKAFMAKARAAYEGDSLWSDAGFMSSSRGTKSAFSGNVVLMLDGKTGVDIGSGGLSHFGDAEREVLFKAGTKWVVTDIRDVGGITIIDMTEAI